MGILKVMLIWVFNHMLSFQIHSMPIMLITSIQLLGQRLLMNTTVKPFTDQQWKVVSHSQKEEETLLHQDMTHHLIHKNRLVQLQLPVVMLLKQETKHLVRQKVLQRLKKLLNRPLLMLRLKNLPINKKQKKQQRKLKKKQQKKLQRFLNLLNHLLRRKAKILKVMLTKPLNHTQFFQTHSMPTKCKRLIQSLDQM